MFHVCLPELMHYYYMQILHNCDKVAPIKVLWKTKCCERDLFKSFYPNLFLWCHFSVSISGGWSADLAMGTATHNVCKSQRCFYYELWVLLLLNSQLLLLMYAQSFYGRFQYVAFEPAVLWESFLLVQLLPSGRERHFEPILDKCPCGK